MSTPDTYLAYRDVDGLYVGICDAYIRSTATIGDLFTCVRACVRACVFRCVHMCTYTRRWKERKVFER